MTTHLVEKKMLALSVVLMNAYALIKNLIARAAREKHANVIGTTVITTNRFSALSSDLSDSTWYTILETTTP
jgi:hypothetical protein